MWRSGGDPSGGGGGDRPPGEAVLVMRTGQVKALWVWSLWMVLGAVLGGVVIAVLAGLLGLFASGGGVDPQLAGALAMIGAVLGAGGGTVAGFVCAAVTLLLDRARGGSTAGGYAAVAGMVTATLTSAVGGWLFRPDPTRVGEAVVWLAVPVVVSTVVAA